MNDRFIYFLLESQLIILLIIILLLIKILKKLKQNEKSSSITNKNTDTPKARKQKIGEIGELETQLILEKVPGKTWFLRNLYINCNNGQKTEIDLIMLHTSGIYVIESKNFKGWIYGKEEDIKWCQVFNKKHKNFFYNPMRQNQNHIKNLIEAMGTEPINTKIIYSVIVFSDDCELVNINWNERHTFVTQRKKLLEILKDKLNQEIYQEKVLEELYYKLLPYCNASEEEKEKHIEYIKNRYK